MRIGVICEGRTDFPAIKHFYGNLLSREGIHAEFEALYPRMDNTRSGAGWPNVLIWLDKNPPASRVQRFFDGGLFGGRLQREMFDAILIQLDADVLDDGSFEGFVRKNYDIEIRSPEEPLQRGRELAAVIRRAARFDDLTDADRQRHILALAVESTETWCLAAFRGKQMDWERLRGNSLTTAFMQALERSEGREPKAEYANCDKDFARRNRFCELHADNADRIVVTCPHFRNGLDGLVAMAPNP